MEDCLAKSDILNEYIIYIIFITYMCTHLCVLCAHEYRYPRRLEVLVLPIAGVTGSGGYWESNADSMKEEHILLTTKPSRVPH